MYDIPIVAHDRPINAERKFQNSKIQFAQKNHASIQIKNSKTQGIEIPAVLVSHATGDRLWSNRSWIPGNGRLRASVGAAGHIELDTRRAGALEMVGIYLLLSVLLMAFSGVCGLLFALALTWWVKFCFFIFFVRWPLRLFFVVVNGELSSADGCSSSCVCCMK